MCCCIPLRKLSYLGSIFHLCTGLLYFYYMGMATYYMYYLPHSRDRLVMGLLYIVYCAAFLPPGVFIFFGVHKKIRKFLVSPPIVFVIIQAYGIGLSSYFGYRPQRFSEAVRLWNKPHELKKLEDGLFMDIMIQISLTIVYTFMLFFYYREIGPESNPVPSRFRQAYLEAPQGGCLGVGGGIGLGGGGQGGGSIIGQGIGSPGAHSAAGGGDRRFDSQIQQQLQHQHSIHHGGGRRNVPNQNDVTFSPFPLPISISSNDANNPRSAAHFLRSSNPMDLSSSFPNLTLEQQRDLAIIQQHPFFNQNHHSNQLHSHAHLQQLLHNPGDPRLLEFLQAQAAQSKKSLY